METNGQQQLIKDDTSKPLIKGWFDGAYSPKRQLARYGWWIIDERNKGITQGCGIVGKGPEMTVNVAEYAGICALAKWIRENCKLNECRIEIRGDSKMVCEMVSGRWGRRNPHREYRHLQIWLQVVRGLLGPYRCDIQWIPRDLNGTADMLSNLEGPRDEFSILEYMQQEFKKSWPI